MVTRKFCSTKELRDGYESGWIAISILHRILIKVYGVFEPLRLGLKD